MNNSQKLVIFAISCLFTALAVFLQIVPMSMYDHVRDRLFITTTDFANLTSLYFVAYAVLQIPNGIFLDKYGIKKLLPLGVFITLVGNLLYWISFSATLIGISRFIIGLGCSISYLGSVFIASQFFKPRFLPLCIAIIEVTSTVGAVLAENTFSFIIITIGWDFSNIIIIILNVIILILLIYFLRKINYQKINSSALKEPFNILEILSSIKFLLSNKLLLGIFLYSFFCWGVIMGFAGFWSTKYFENMHHYTLTQSFELSEIYWYSFLFFALVVSFLVKSIHTIKVLVITLASVGLVSYGLMSIPILFNKLLLILFCIFGGLSASGVILGFSLIPYLVKPDKIGRAMALNNTFVVLGGFAAQIIFGLIKDTSVNHSIFLEGINMHYYNGLLVLLAFTILSLISISFTILRMRNRYIIE